MKDRSLFPAVASHKRSMCSNGKMSFGHALLRFVKSTHTDFQIFAQVRADFDTAIWEYFVLAYRDNKLAGWFAFSLQDFGYS